MGKHRTRYTILGAGNGGQAIAGYLSHIGYEVRLYDAVEDTIKKIKDKGGIELEGVVRAFASLALITTDIEKAIKGADVIMVVNPSIYHREIAQKCAPYLTADQIVFLHPGATFGAFAFKKTLEDSGCSYEIPIAESNTLIYACRSIEPGKVNIGGKKERILVATLPAKDNDRVCSLLKEAYPEIEMAKNVLVTSLDNTNPLFHPAPTLLSTSWVESGKDFLYYYEGISETIGDFIDEMDKERIQIAKALGLEYGTDIIDALMQYEFEYSTKGENISDVVKRVKAYANICGPKTLKTRYVYEDIPMGLVPLVSVGKLLNVPTERIQMIIRLGELVLKEDFMNNGRNLKNLGLEGMTAERIIKFAETGEKC